MNMLDPPRFVPGDFVTMRGTRPGACHRVLECLGVTGDNVTSFQHRWYMIEIGGVNVRVCEGDLSPVEVVSELGRIVDDA
jgi:hypothetical protein